jgi:MFS family permease
MGRHLTVTFARCAMQAELATATAAGRLPRLREQHAFLRFWLARAAATAALQMLVLVMGWQMYELTRDPWDLGLLGLAQFIPAVLVSLPAGQMADRLHRGRLLAVCYGAQAVGALLLLAGTLQGDVARSLLLFAAALLGTTRGFLLPAQQSLVPMLVPAALLPRAVALNASAGQVAIMGGPALGGLLLLSGPSLAYGCCLGLLAAAAWLAATLRQGAVAASTQATDGSGLLEGFRFVWQRPELFGALSLDLLAVLLGGVTALLPMFASDVLGVGPAGLGLLRSAPAVGALGMAAVLARVSLSRQVGARMMAAVAVYATAMGVFGLSTQLWLSLLALAVSGAADMVSAVVRHTLLQTRTPDAMRGRVSAVNALFMGASNQLGEFESGATAAMMGPVGSVLFGSVATLCIVIAWLRLFPQLYRTGGFTHEDP